MKKVLYPEDIRVFNDLLRFSWLSKGYDEESIDGTTDCFLFPDDSGNWVGTLELNRFTCSTYEALFPIYPNSKEILRSHIALEIDKLSIASGYRGRGLLYEMFKLISEFSYQNEVTHCVALLEPSFFKSLMYFYHFPLQEIGDTFVYKGDMVVPTMLDVVSCTETLTKIIPKSSKKIRNK